MTITVYPIGTDVIIKYAKVPGYIDQICIAKGNTVKYGVVYYAEKIRQSIWVDYKEIEINEEPETMLRIRGFSQSY